MTPTLQIADMIHDLVEPMRHREPLDSIAAAVRRHAGHPKPRVHECVFPSLLDQLRIAVTWDSGQESGPSSRPSAESSTPGNEDALDVLLRVESGAAGWIAGEGRLGLEQQLRGLVGLSTVVGPEDLNGLRRDVSSWRAWCRVETGWDRRAFTADVACPCCLHRSLRVRGDGTAARCGHCGSAWSEDRDMLPSVHELGIALEKVAVAVRDSA